MIAHPPVPSTSQRVTLPELREMTDLASEVDRRVSPLCLLSESEESDENDELDPAHNAGASAADTKPQRTGKLKSGKEARVTCTVRFPQLWPHSDLSFVHAKRDLEYEDLTIEEFVVG